MRWRLAILGLCLGVVVGCGGAATDQSTPMAGSTEAVPLATFASHGFSFRYPASWRTRTFGLSSSFSSPLVYLSNEPMHHPCVHHHFGHGETSVRCSRPLDRLGPGGVLVSWTENGSPTWKFADAKGRPLMVGGDPAKLGTSLEGCPGLGAARGLDLVVKRTGAESNWYELRACMAGPDPAPNEEAVRALITSTRLVGSAR